MIGALVCSSMFAAVALVTLLGRTRLWWAPGMVSLGGGLSFLVDAARPPACEGDPFCGLDVVGNAVDGMVGLGLLVVGAIVLAVAHAIRTEHLARRNAPPTLPVARVIR